MKEKTKRSEMKKERKKDQDEDEYGHERRTDL